MTDPLSRAMQHAGRALSASAVIAVLVSAGCSSNGWSLKDRTGLWQSQTGRPAQRVLSQREGEPTPAEPELAQKADIPAQPRVIAQEIAKQSSRRTAGEMLPAVRTVSVEMLQPASLTQREMEQPEPQISPAMKPQPQVQAEPVQVAQVDEMHESEQPRRGFLRRWLTQMRGEPAQHEAHEMHYDDDAPEAVPQRTQTYTYRPPQPSQPKLPPLPPKFESRRVAPEGPVVKAAPTIPEMPMVAERPAGPVVKAAPMPFKLFDTHQANKQENTDFADRLAESPASKPHGLAAELRRDSHEEAVAESNALREALDHAPAMEGDIEVGAERTELRRLASSRRPQALANLRRLATSEDPQEGATPEQDTDEKPEIAPFRAPQVASSQPIRQPVLEREPTPATRPLVESPAETKSEPVPETQVTQEEERRDVPRVATAQRHDDPQAFELPTAPADQAAVESAPLEPNLEAAYMVANWAQASYDEIRNYRAELIRRRLVDNQLSSREKVYFTCNRKLGAISAAWDPSPQPRRQWLFVAGQNDNQILVSEESPLGRIRSLVEPSGASDGVRPMTEWGIGPTIARLRGYLEQHLAGQAEVKYEGLENRPEVAGLLHHVVAKPKGVRQVVHFYFATTNLLPVLTQVVDANGRVLEYEFFEKIETNLADLDRPGVFASAQPADRLLR